MAPGARRGRGGAGGELGRRLASYVGRFRMIPTRANRQPAVATYVRRVDDPAYRAFAISVLRIEDDRIVEATAFHDLGLFPAFALPTTLPPTHR